MVYLIEETNRVNIWIEAVKHLLENGREYNVILSVEDPLDGPEQIREIEKEINEFHRSKNEYPLNTVADTIFPSKHRHLNADELWEIYSKEYSLFRKAKRSWGTYAHRMLVRTNEVGDKYNPLADMIDKMNKSSEKKFRSAYELNMIQKAADIPVYRGFNDRGRYYGSPCLSHLSFKYYDELHLTAIYRSHDYTYKLPGNLLGLARLQSWVAKQTDTPVGKLVVHSTDAFISQKRDLKKLISKVEKILED